MTDILKKAIVTVLAEKYPDMTVPDFNIDVPTDRTRADYVCTVAFLLSKQLNKDPFTVTSEIVDALNARKIPEASFAAARPGFINITLTDAYLLDLSKKAFAIGDRFGNNTSLAGQKWVVEHTSPNPNKAMHIGHLRNNLIGMSVSAILEANGATVICDAVDNDRGIAIVKAMWGYLYHKHDGSKYTSIKKSITPGSVNPDTYLNYWFIHQDEWLTPEELKMKSDHFVGECYLLGAEDFKTNPDFEAIMRAMLLKWEAKDKQVWALWSKVLAYVHAGIEQTLKRLGNRWDKVWHEHEHYALGKEMVQLGLKKGVFVTTPEKTVITQLEKYKIPDTVVLRSDGASLYITQDLALTKLKRELYSADKLVWVIGPEQSMAMKQMFAVCEQLGMGKMSDFFHISYGLVVVKDAEGNKKKMSSRGGEAALIDDFIDTVKAQLIAERPTYADEEAEKVTLAAIKFMILKSGRTADVVFDTAASLRLDGDSGVYILYTYARLCSLLAKGAASKNAEENKNFIFSKAEKEVLVNISYFPIVVKNALPNFSPQLIAEYLIQLCQSFSSLYSNEKFIDEDNAAETEKKLFIAEVCALTIKNALKILGIIPVQKM